VYFGSVCLVIGIFAMIYIRERRIWFLVKKKKCYLRCLRIAKTRGLKLSLLNCKVN